MSKAYIVTAVDYGDSVDGKARTIGVFFDRKTAEAAKVADIRGYRKGIAKEPTAYNEGKGWCYHDDHTGCEWNIEEVNIPLPLTPLQFTELNGIAYKISSGEYGLDEFEDLSDEETEYLKYTLKTTYHINTETTKEDK